MENRIENKIDEYLKNNWDQMVDDIASLVKIPSYSYQDRTDEYPTGPKAAEALNQALKIAKRLGMRTINDNNIIGLAQVKGKSKTEIGFISHIDVVPDGYGWKFKPFELGRINGYLTGRGVIDDKGPTILLLHAIKFWLDQKVDFPYSIQYILGTDEEISMTDVDYFLENYEQPKVVITPDADFPICLGEKGIFQPKVYSKRIKNCQILELEGGTSDNAVAGVAYAHVQLPKNGTLFKEGSRLAHAIIIEPLENDVARIIAKGISAHASTPFEGIDGIAILAQFMLERNLGNKQEQDFLRFVCRVAGKPDGSGVGLNVEDEHFGELTIVPSRLSYQKGVFKQVFDVRYPASITYKEILTNLKKYCPEGCTIQWKKDKTPFFIDPESDLVKCLAKSYQKATGKKADTFTMGGGTYACKFNCATSFGPEMPWIINPAWVGGIHGPDEAVSEKTLKSAFRIYTHMIMELMSLNLDKTK